MASTNPAEQVKVSTQSDNAAAERRAAPREPLAARQGSLGASPVYQTRAQAGWETVQPFGGPPGQQPMNPAFIQSPQPVWPHGTVPYMQPQVYMYPGLPGQHPSFFPAGSLHPAQRPVPQMLSPLGMMVAGQQYPMNPMLPFTMAPAPTQESWLQARQMRPQPGVMPGIRPTGWGGVPFQSPQHPQPQQTQRWQQPQRQEMPSTPSRRPDKMQAQPPPPPPRAGSMPPTAQAQKELAPAGPVPSPTAATASSRSSSLPILEQQQAESPRQPEQAGIVGAAPGPSGKVPCAFFLKTGTCAYGDKCKFEHPWDKLPVVRFNSMGLPLRHGQPECAYYLRHARCGFGPSCKFHHPEPGTSGIPDMPGAAAHGSLDSQPRPQLVPAPPEAATGALASIALGAPAALATGTPVAANPGPSASSENVAPTSSSSSSAQVGCEGDPPSSLQAPPPHQAQQPAAFQPHMPSPSMPGSVYQQLTSIPAAVQPAAFGLPIPIPMVATAAQPHTGQQQQQAAVQQQTVVQPQAVPVASIPQQQAPGTASQAPSIQMGSAAWHYTELPQQQSIGATLAPPVPLQVSPHSAGIASSIAVSGTAPSAAIPTQPASVSGQPTASAAGHTSAPATAQLPVQQVAVTGQLPIQQIAVPAQPTVPGQAFMAVVSQPAQVPQYMQLAVSAPVQQVAVGVGQAAPGVPLQPLHQVAVQQPTMQLPQQQVPMQQLPVQAGPAVLPGQQLGGPQMGLFTQPMEPAHSGFPSATPVMPQQTLVAGLPQQPIVAAMPQQPLVASMPWQPVLASTQAVLSQVPGLPAGQPLVAMQPGLITAQQVPLMVSPAYQSLVTQSASAASAGPLTRAHTIPTMQMLSPAASKDIGHPDLEELTAGLPDLHLSTAESNLDSSMSIKTPLPSEASVATVSTTSSVSSGKLSNDAARAIETVRHAMQGRGSFREEDEEEQDQEERGSRELNS